MGHCVYLLLLRLLKSKFETNGGRPGEIYEDF